MYEAIKDIINKMAKANKCFSLILSNAHAAYVYAVLKIYKELEIPKGNYIKMRTLTI